MSPGASAYLEHLYSLVLVPAWNVCFLVLVITWDTHVLWCWCLPGTRVSSGTKDHLGRACPLVLGTISGWCCFLPLRPQPREVSPLIQTVYVPSAEYIGQSPSQPLLPAQPQDSGVAGLCVEVSFAGKTVGEA